MPKIHGFSSTGGEQQFVVPQGVTSIDIEAKGASGGAGSPGGSVIASDPASASTRISVTPGEVLYVEVGGRGEDSNATSVPCQPYSCYEAKGGFNGGGFSGSVGAATNGRPQADSGGGGGGASDVRTKRAGVSGSGASRLVVGAGGGGDGGMTTPNGQQSLIGVGGSAGSPGGDGGSPAQKDDGGGGGAAATSNAEGTGGKGGATSEGSPYYPGQSGSTGGLYQGFVGNGGSGGGNVETLFQPYANSGAGGGGGGGYYGGGGGGGGGVYNVPAQGDTTTDGGSGGGGGGGSSYAPGGTVTVVSGPTDGHVYISWKQPRNGAPSISDLLLRPSAFAAQGGNAGPGAGLRGSGNGGASSATGTRVSYHDSEAATTDFTIFRSVKGIKRGGKCVAPGPGAQHGRRCQRLVPIGGFSHRDQAGTDSFHFTGNVNRHKPAPGSYVLAGVPHFGGKTGPVTMTDFRIIA